MTLVLTALTPKHIVQVSDRRVVMFGRAGETLQTDDERIKAIITPLYACGYSGPAQLGNGDTAEWLAVLLSDHVCKPDGGISIIASAIQHQTTLQKVSNRPLTVVCAGWLGEDGKEPLAYIISNMNQLTCLPLYKFDIFEGAIPRNKMSAVWPTGVQLNRSEFTHVNGLIEKLCRANLATAQAIANILAACVWSVAKRNTSVSDEVLISSLPFQEPRLSKVVGKLVEVYWSVTCIKAGEQSGRAGGPIIVGNKGVWQAYFSEKPPRPRTGARMIRGSNMGISFITDPPLGEAWEFPGMGPQDSYCNLNPIGP